MVSLRSVGNCHVHGDFENIFTFKTQMSSLEKTSKDKQKLKVTRNLNPRHASQTNINTTEHELKYSEASRSSFLKLVLGKLKPIEAMQNNYNSNLLHPWLN